MGPWPTTLRNDVLGLLAIALLVSIVGVLGLDLAIANATFDRDAVEFGKLGNQLAAWMGYPSVLVLVWLAVPTLRRKWPLLSRCLSIYVLTLLIAVLGGITNLKTETNRPRPLQVSQFDGPYAYQVPFGFDPDCSKCKAFPSSSAGWGFLLATPFFVLRRKRRPLAIGFGVAGLGLGWFIGYARIVSGNHWITDVVWSMALVGIVASVLAHLTVEWNEA